jgi:acyl carrier protein
MDIPLAVKDIIAQIDPEGRERDIGNDDSLFESGILDSLKMMQLIPLIEKKFSVVFQPEDLTPENFCTINNLSSYISGKG